MADYNSDRTGSNIDLTLDKVDALDAKVQPTSTGVDVTGTITADGLKSDGNIQITSNGTPTLDASLTGLQISRNSYPQIVLDAQGELNGEKLLGIANDERGMLFRRFDDAFTTSAYLAKFSANGDVLFYEDTGTTAKMVWDASAESLGIGTASPDHTLRVNGDGRIGNLHFKESEYTGGSGKSIWADGAGTGVLGFNSSTAMQFNTGGSERMRIDSAGNVGIGTASPSVFSQYKGLTISDSAGGFVEMKSTTGSITTFIAADNGTGGGVVGTRTNDSLQLRTNDTERARIDSSGNLLVGTTDAEPWNNSSGTNSDNGAVVGSAYLSACQRNNASLRINRTSTDGDLQVFYKNGSTVGSIGTQGGALTFANAARGFKMDGSSLEPIYSAGTEANGVNDLGVSANRWRNLYLSGGVYLGGTGEINKLDDYETGTFTATVAPSGTGTLGLYSTEDKLAYTKVGNLVTITGRLFFNSKSSPVGGSIAISTLPFIVGNLSESSGFVGGSVAYRDGITTSWSNIPFYALEADNKIYIVKDASTINVDDRIHFSFSYMTA